MIYGIYEPHIEKTCFFRYLDSAIPLPKSEISSLLPSTVAVQPG